MTSTARSGSATALQARVAQIVAAAGRRSAAEVYDVTAGRRLFALRPTFALPPGSVEKLYTTVAALQRLGPDAHLHTTLLGAGRLREHGVWDGDLYLRGGGDPTFGDLRYNVRVTGGRGATAEKLADNFVRGTAIRRVRGRLYADESLFDTRRGGPWSGYRRDLANIGGELGALTFDHGDIGHDHRRGPGVYAALRMAKALRARGVAVRAGATTRTTPRHARTLAGVESPSLATIVQLTDVRSDVFYAELVAEQLGARFGGRGSIASGARVIRATLARFGIAPRIVDGSGVSHADRTAPRDVVRLLTAVARGPLALTLRVSLPVAGVSGTLARRMQGTAAASRCWAKTGTLRRVSNIAGYCRQPGHHLLAFAFMIDGLRVRRARALQDRLLTELVARDPG